MLVSTQNQGLICCLCFKDPFPGLLFANLGSYWNCKLSLLVHSTVTRVMVGKDLENNKDPNGVGGGRCQPVVRQWRS